MNNINNMNNMNNMGNMNNMNINNMNMNMMNMNNMGMNINNMGNMNNMNMVNMGNMPNAMNTSLNDANMNNVNNMINMQNLMMNNTNNFTNNFNVGNNTDSTNFNGQEGNNSPVLSLNNPRGNLMQSQDSLLLNLDPVQPVINMYRPNSGTSCFICERFPPPQESMRSLRFYPMQPEHCALFNIEMPKVVDKKYFVCHYHHSQHRKHQPSGLQGSQSEGDLPASQRGGGHREGGVGAHREWADYEKIMKLKNENSKSDTSRIDLMQLHAVLVRTSSVPLEECYQDLYEVFNIKTKNRKDKEGKEREGKPETPELNKKLIRNNIKFKIKNLLNTYPHLNFYGHIKDFQLARLQAVPDVLLSVDNQALRRRFQEFDPVK